MADEGRTSARGQKKRKIPEITHEYLQRVALAHLGRFASSTESLRRVLLRRVRRAAKVHGSSEEEGAQLVERVLLRYQDAGLLDDRVYAAARAHRLHRAGRAMRAIEADLQRKGIEPAIVSDTLAELMGEVENADLKAAATFAKKRRIGPYRPEELRRPTLARDLASLARRGFSFDVARRVLHAESGASLEAQL